MKVSLLSVILLLAASTGLCSAPDSERVALVEQAAVHRETICLSDLLPMNSPDELRTTAGAIELGHSPQPGTLRVLEAWQIREQLSGQTELLRRIFIPARVIVHRVGWPIRRETARTAITNFLQQEGWSQRSLPGMAKIESMGQVDALAEDPALEVTGTTGTSVGAPLEFRLRCVEAALCGSFLVRLRPAVISGISPKRGGLPGTAGNDHDDGPVLAERGDAAILILDGGNVRIRLPVVCLQRGTLRQQIRARAAIGQRVFQAEVVGADLLRAAF